MAYDLASAKARIHSYCRRPGGKAALAREAGLRRSTVQRVMRDDWNPTLTTLQALLEALDRLEGNVSAAEAA